MIWDQTAAFFVRSGCDRMNVKGVHRLHGGRDQGEILNKSVEREHSLFSASESGDGSRLCLRNLQANVCCIATTKHRTWLTVTTELPGAQRGRGSESRTLKWI